VNGKLLIVEDEPIVALDLQQEVEQLGCEVIGLAESADEALLAVEESRPDLALMDVRIVGSMDGIQTARLLRDAYEIPVIFLTSYSDDETIARAAREMPYGYLTKPFQSRELKAALQVALHKAKVDAGLRAAHRKIAATFHGMHDALLMVSLTGDIQFMNVAAEHLTGRTHEFAANRGLFEVLDLRDDRGRPVPVLNGLRNGCMTERFGLHLKPAGGGSVLVDIAVSPLFDDASGHRGYVLSLRKADERLRSQAADGARDETDTFDLVSMPMVQLDGNGHIVRVNQALMQESGVAAESLIGRTLKGLSTDPDPRISKKLLRRLLEGDLTASTAPPQVRVQGVFTLSGEAPEIPGSHRIAL
jgi:PAS domain S-box-containing protein